MTVQTILDSAESILSRYTATIQWTVAAIGWAYALKLKLKSNEVLITVDSEDGAVVLMNHSPFPIEILQGGMDIFDMMKREEYAKKYHFMYQPSGILSPSEKKVLFHINGKLVEALEEIWQPNLNQIQQFSPSMDTGRFAKIRIYINYKKADSKKPRHMKLERQISGHPNHGWGISYHPYHFANGFAHTLRRRFDHLKRFLKSPWSEISQIRKRSRFQRHLDVVGILSAVRDGVINQAEAEKKLKRLLKMEGDELIKEVHELMGMKQDAD